MYLAIWLGFFTLIAGIGILAVYGRTPIDEVIFNAFPIEFKGGGGGMVWAGVLGLGVLPILLTLSIAFWQFRRRRTHRCSEVAPRRRTTKRGRRTLGTAMVAGLLVAGITTFGTTVSLPSYVRAATSPYSVSQYYKDPQVTSTKDAHNLVLIYLESGEATLSDTNLFDEDPFKPLEKAAGTDDGWKTIDDFKQFEGGGWTMAGITSTSCGIPLKSNGLLSGKKGLNEVSGVDTYLSGVTCLGDILKDNGYKNVFMGGANASFASKDVFLKTHGYGEEFDLRDWENANEPEDEFRPDWGLSDGRLLEHAKTETDELHDQSEKTGQPFSLSMLTLDTHEPPHMYPYCEDTTENPLTSAYRCSNQKVADYIDYMKKKGYLEDTAVVIMGDHYKHMNPKYSFHEQLDDNPNRTIFNRIWVPGDDRDRLKTRSGIDQLNLLPTILEATGFEVRNREAGLGVSAFASEGEIPKDSAQAMDPEPYKEMLQARSSDFYEKAWGDQGTLEKGDKVDKEVHLNDQDSGSEQDTKTGRDDGQ
jgi:phosphoglycerol transferase